MSKKLFKGEVQSNFLEKSKGLVMQQKRCGFLESAEAGLAFLNQHSFTCDQTKLINLTEPAFSGMFMGILATTVSNTESSKATTYIKFVRTILHKHAKLSLISLFLPICT